MHPVNSVTLLGVIVNGPAKAVSLNTPYKNMSKKYCLANGLQLHVWS